MRHQVEAALRQLALQANSDRQDLRLGQITSADAATHSVKVLYQPEGTESDFLPFACVVFGPGAGVFALPGKDSQAAVDHEMAQAEAGVAQSSVCDDNFAPPAGFQQGEFWVVLTNGVTLKLTNDGKVTVLDAHGSSVVLNNDGTATITANLTINGSLHATQNISSDQTVTGSVDVVGGGKSLKTHVHTGVTTGSGVSGPPQ